MHEAIAREVARALGLPKRLEKVLCRSVVEPDKKREVSEVHHEPFLSRRRALNHIWKAREAHLRRDDSGAARSLGWALHFIHDACVPRGYILPFHGYYTTEDLIRVHDYVEREAARMEVPWQAVEAGIREALNSPHYVEGVVKSVKPARDPGKALARAAYASAAIAKAVFSETEPPEKLVQDYRLAKKRYLRKTIPLALLASALAFLAAFATLPQLTNEYSAFITLTVIAALLLVERVALLLPLLFLFPYGLGSIVNAAVSGFIAGYAAQKLDFRFHRLRKEAKWFGLR